ncbi:MAG: hypoxanthine phosphoribosyltransferase [Phycisphaeraceae bacterium]
MQADIERILIDRDTIASRVRELAQEITRDLCGDDPAACTLPGGPASGGITFIPILTGGFIFAADLIRQLPLMMQIRLISVSSYPGTATSSRGARLREELTTLPQSLEGTHVIVIDDILDSGQTLKLVTGVLQERNPASVRTCVLLRKQRPEAMATHVDYLAFDIPDEFVVGYGLDYDDYYRNLPDIATLRPHVYGGTSEPQATPSPSAAGPSSSPRP